MSLSGLLFTSLIATPSADAHPSSGSFDVRFQDCTEFVGIAELSLEDAEKLVPEEFTVQLNDLGSASLVVRTVDCEGISVGRRGSRPGRLSQIGITVNGPLFINNYTLFYTTDDPLLWARLILFGMPTAFDRRLDYVVVEDGSGGGALEAQVNRPFRAAYELTSDVGAPSDTPVFFSARWSRDVRRGTVVMDTEFPGLQFGQASTTLTTRSTSVLADLLGTDTFSDFMLLDSYNAFLEAEMTVTLQ